MSRDFPRSIVPALLALLGPAAACGLDRFEVAPEDSPAWDVADRTGDAEAPDAEVEAGGEGEAGVEDGGDGSEAQDTTCPPGSTFCVDRCWNLNVAREHCGVCGRFCGAHGDCINALCVCYADYTFCADGCVKLASDRANCGACGLACAADENCRGGECG